MALADCINTDPKNITIIENNDGTVSVFVNVNNKISPIQLTKSCCEVIKPTYVFDINFQKCLWSTGSTCNLDNPFKLVLNPKGNDGTLFFVEDDDNCSLNIQFDYLFKIKCETLGNILISNNSECKSPIDVFESFDASITIDIITSANTLETVFEAPLFPAIGKGNLYSYLVSHPTNSGFYVCGDPTGNETFSACTTLSLNLTAITQSNTHTCANTIEPILTDLYRESISSGTTGTTQTFLDTIKPNALASNWLTYNTLITDKTILKLIANKKIKLSININHSCSDFCVLVDEISLNKVCTHTEKTNIFLTQSPGFNLDRIRDNKKSWVGNSSPTNRTFVISNNNGNNPIRQTNYDVNDERLIINSKEIDLDISLASAIETDVWSYLVGNPCLLSAITTCTPCSNMVCDDKDFQDNENFFFMDNDVYEFMDSPCTGTGLTQNVNCCGDFIDFNSLLTQPLSAITTVEDFEFFITSELIDAKSRQTLSGYPTLRALYDRYVNSNLYCNTNSSKFNYLTVDQFANLLGTFWVDIIEQVVPATTIWGSVKIYSNTIFDQQKFKYKSYTSLFGGNPFSGQTISNPINGTHGNCAPVEVIITNINLPGTGLTVTNQVITKSNAICLAQMNIGSEFIGEVTIIGPNQNNNNNGAINSN